MAILAWALVSGGRAPTRALLPSFRRLPLFQTLSPSQGPRPPRCALPLPPARPAAGFGPAPWRRRRPPVGCRHRTIMRCAGEQTCMKPESIGRFAAGWLAAVCASSSGFLAWAFALPPPACPSAAQDCHERVAKGWSTLTEDSLKRAAAARLAAATSGLPVGGMATREQKFSASAKVAKTRLRKCDTQGCGGVRARPRRHLQRGAGGAGGER